MADGPRGLDHDVNNKRQTFIPNHECPPNVGVKMSKLRGFCCQKTTETVSTMFLSCVNVGKDSTHAYACDC